MLLLYPRKITLMMLGMIQQESCLQSTRYMYTLLYIHRVLCVHSLCFPIFFFCWSTLFRGLGERLYVEAHAICCPAQGRPEREAKGEGAEFGWARHLPLPQSAQTPIRITRISSLTRALYGVSSWPAAHPQTMQPLCPSKEHITLELSPWLRDRNRRVALT